MPGNALLALLGGGGVCVCTHIIGTAKPNGVTESFCTKTRHVCRIRSRARGRWRNGGGAFCAVCEICDNDRRVVSCAAGARRRLCAVTRPRGGWAGAYAGAACPGRSGSTSLHPSLGAASATTSATAAAAPIGIAGSERGTIAWRGLVRLSARGCRAVHDRSHRYLRRNPVRPAPAWLGKTGSADQ